MVSPSFVCSTRGTSGLYGIFSLSTVVQSETAGRNEIQYVMDLRAKLHTLGQLSRENLLEAQEHQQRLYNRGTASIFNGR